MASEFFNDDDNLAELVSHMAEEDQARFRKYGHFRVEAVFKDRIFIIYSPTGLTHDNTHRDPDVLTTVRVTDFSMDLRSGCVITMLDQSTEQELRVGHVPKRLFNYPVYVSAPPRLTLRWDARYANGRVWRSLAFALLIKTRNKSSFYSKGNVYMETPNEFARFFPSVTGEFRF